MKRRTVLQLSAAMLTMPGWARAQAQKVYRLGWLATTDEATTRPFLEGALIPGMGDLGYAVGRNLAVDIRYSRGDAKRLPALADELITLKPDVLLGIESACVAMAAKTSTIPIVNMAGADPVAAGLVKSLARPGTNVTGMSNQVLTAKHVELLAEIVPKLSRIVLINDATNPARESHERMAREATAAKKLALLVINATPNPDGIRAAFAQAGTQRNTGVVVPSSGPMIMVRSTFAEEASRLRGPAVYGIAQFVDAGGLISYGQNVAESYRKEVPPYVDRILKGANPAEMPVQQSAKFEMVVNLKTARALGLTIPPTVLFRADRVIE